MSIREIGLASVGWALVLCVHSVTPAVAEEGDRDLGEQIASRECAGCHGVAGAKGVTIQGIFVPSFSEIARRPNQSRQRLEAFITIPRHPMPGLPLQSRELKHLAEYIYSLRH